MFEPINLPQTFTAFALLITALTSFGAMAFSWWNAKQIAGVAKNTEAIHLTTNSMKDALMVKTDEAATAKGTLVGRAEMKQEVAEGTIVVPLQKGDPKPDLPK